MKKILGLCLAAAVLAAVPQHASAWSNIRFGAGVNLHWQTADNNLLWGGFRNGQIPSPYGHHGHDGFHGHHGHHHAPMPFYPIDSVAPTAEPVHAGTQNAGPVQAAPVSNYHFSSNPYSYYSHDAWYGW